MDILTSIEESVDLEEFTPTAKVKDGGKVKRARLAEIHRELTQSALCVNKSSDVLMRLKAQHEGLEEKLEAEAETLISELSTDD